MLSSARAGAATNMTSHKARAVSRRMGIPSADEPTAGEAAGPRQLTGSRGPCQVQPRVWGPRESSMTWKSGPGTARPRLTPTRLIELGGLSRAGAERQPRPRGGHPLLDPEVVH